MYYKQALLSDLISRSIIRKQGSSKKLTLKISQSFMKGRGDGSTQFLALRKRIDKLGYNDFALGLDSAPLANQLVNDIFYLTETLRTTYEENQTIKTDIQMLQAQIEPLQEENTRLRRENNQLHQWMITTTENQRTAENRCMAQVEEVEAENRRLKLIGSKNQDTIKDLKAQLEKTKIQLQEAIDTPTQIESRSRRDSRSRRTTSRSRRTGSVAPSLDQMSMASAQSSENEITRLTEQLDATKEEAASKSKEVDILTAKINEINDLIKLRDDEIVRLGEELQKETGKDGYLLTLRHKLQVQQIEIEKLKAQMMSGAKSEDSAVGARRNVKLLLTPPKMTFSMEEISRENAKESNNEEKEKEKLTKSQRGIGHISIDVPEDTSSAKELEEEEEEEDLEDSLPPQKAPPAPTPFETTQRIEIANAADAGENKELEQLKMDLKVIKAQLESAKEEVQAKEVTIAQMLVDFAYVRDSLEEVIGEKDSIISKLRAQLANKDSAESDKEANENEEEYKEKIETLQMQVDESKAMHQADVEERDKKIFQLETLLQQMSSSGSSAAPIECPVCPKLRLQIEELQKAAAGPGAAQLQELEELRKKSAQLELIIRSTEESMRESSDVNQRLLLAQHKLTDRENQVEEAKHTISSLQKQIDKLQSELEEAQKTSNTVPELKQKFRTILERMKIEYTSKVEELNQKNITVQHLTDKLAESQKMANDFMSELQKVRNENVRFRDETMVHRTKSEDVQRICAEKVTTMKQENNAAISHYQMQLDDCVHQNEVLKKLLSDTRRQMAPLTEKVIPELRGKVADLTRERSELAARVDRVMKLSQFTEKSTKFSPDAVQFIAALHQLQDLLRPFAEA